LKIGGFTNLAESKFGGFNNPELEDFKKLIFKMVGKLFIIWMINLPIGEFILHFI
jgi:hypothetical protein